MNVDLFEYPDLIPPDLKVITDKWDQHAMSEGMTYDTCGEFLKEVEVIGYTFDFCLAAQPYGLRKIGVDIDDLEGW